MPGMVLGMCDKDEDFIILKSLRGRGTGKVSSHIVQERNDVGRTQASMWQANSLSQMGTFTFSMVSPSENPFHD